MILSEKTWNFLLFCPRYAKETDVMTKLREKSKNVSYAAVDAVGGQERAVWARGQRKCHGKCDCVWR